MKKTFAFIFSLFLLCLIPSLQAKDKKKVVLSDTIPFFNGMSAGVDLIQPIGIISGNYYKGIEFAVDADLKHRYFPIVEFGGGKYDRTKNYLDFSSLGGFMRLGLNYNLFPNQQSDNYGYIGCRYGLAYEQYDYKGISTTASYWGNTKQSEALGQKAFTHWIEVVAGVKVQLYKRLSMGWCFRYKVRMGQSECEYGAPFHIPGYGKNFENGAIVTYSLFYQFNKGKK